MKVSVEIELPVLKFKTWQSIDKNCAADRVAHCIFADMLQLARPIVVAYMADLMHDAIHLKEFQDRLAMRLAKSEFDCVNNRMNIDWACRNTGTDYSDDKVNTGIGSMRCDLSVSYSVEVCPYDSFLPLHIRRIVHKAPDGWIDQTAE